MKLTRYEAYMRHRAARKGVAEGDAPARDDAGSSETPPEKAVLPDNEATPGHQSDPLVLYEPVPETGPETEPELDHGPTVAPAPAPQRAAASTGLMRPDSAAAWAALSEVPLVARHLTRNRLISAAREDPSHVAFDVLRTKLLATLRKRGWNRVAVTSATPDCGKSFVAANLAISLSRKPGLRTVLMDMDLRRPSLARLFGVKAPGQMSQFLVGNLGMEDHLLRPAPNELKIGATLAFGLNDRTESFAAELLQSPAAAEALAGMQARLLPDVVLYDMPPALYYDDVLAFRQHFDGVLIVVAGGMSTAQEVHDLKDQLGSDTPLLGVVMNRAEGEDITRYEY